jgi:plasmid maintenance system antidote protein VapI
MRRLSKEEMTRVYIGCLVEQKMAELGLNKTTAGELAGITRAQVGWIINGVKDITIPTLFKLQWALKLDLDLNLKKIFEFNKSIHH